MSKKLVDVAREVIASGHYQESNGYLLDSFTASAIVAVYDKLSSENQAKFDNLSVEKAVSIVWKLVK